MTDAAALVAPAAAWAVGGLLLGAGYFAVLRWTVGRFAAGGGRLTPIVLTLARLVGAMLFFAATAWYGALPLLAAFLGFLVARGCALRIARRTV